jgi:hypothetical protein
MRHAVVLMCALMAVAALAAPVRPTWPKNWQGFTSSEFFMNQGTFNDQGGVCCKAGGNCEVQIKWHGRMFFALFDTLQSVM